MTQNFTALPDEMVKKPAPVAGVPHKEAEPLRIDTGIRSEISEDVVEEQVEAQPTADVAQHVTVVPEKVALTKEQEDLGVQAAETSIFVQGKKIDVHIPAEEVEAGLQKPMTSGWRWMAELIKYILHKFHMSVKKVSGVFQYVKE
ncbi:MAG: hypothetical protein WC775_02070 [Patescibacteria group bacterium]|jgi:hypothetical protein